MTDYTKLTEREINEATGNATGLYWWYSERGNPDKYSDNFEECTGGEAVPLPDYCNNPKDWSPLLEELRELGLIKINADDVFFRKYNESATIAVEADTLGKAICILWLMVKGE